MPNPPQYYSNYSARVMVDEGIKIATQGADVVTIEGNWLPATENEGKISVNYQQYIAAKSQALTSGLSEEAAREVAAQETWTWNNVAKRYGYTEITVIEDQRTGIVQVKFTKPST